HDFTQIEIYYNDINNIYIFIINSNFLYLYCF
ncbi:unnamed protein product, partial [marine sediment metagenome]